MSYRRSTKRVKGLNSRKSQRGAGAEPCGEILYKGSRLLNPTLAVGANVVSLQPDQFDPNNLSTLSDTFSNYRFENLRVKSFPGGSNSFVTQYSNQTSDAPPVNLAAAAYSPYSTLIDDGITTAQSMNVPSKYLLGEGALKYYRTRTSTAGTPTSDAWETIQGFFNIVTGTAGAVFVLIKYVIRFANAINAGATPSPRNRYSLVKKMGWSGSIMDMYLPNDQIAPFPADLFIDVEWIRMRQYRKSDELERLEALVKDKTDGTTVKYMPIGKLFTARFLSETPGVSKGESETREVKLCPL